MCANVPSKYRQELSLRQSHSVHFFKQATFCLALITSSAAEVTLAISPPYRSVDSHLLATDRNFHLDGQRYIPEHGQSYCSRIITASTLLGIFLQF